VAIRTLGLIAGSDVLAMATWFSASAVILPLASAFGVAAHDRGWITGAVQLGFVCGAVASAAIALADWAEPRTLVRSGILLAAFANAAIVAVHSPGVLLALRFCTGIGLALVYPPTVRLLTAMFPRSRGVATGIAVGALTLGSFAPHLLSTNLPWKTVVLGASALAVCGIALISLVPRVDMPHAARFDVLAVPRVLRNHNVLLADAGYWGHMWELYAVWAWGPVFLAASLHAAHAAVPAGALVFAAFGIAGALGCLVGGTISDRIGRVPVATAALFISGCTSFCIGFTYGENPWLVSALFAVWGVSVIADSPQFSVAVSELSPPQYAGTALTLQMGVGFLITMITIWLVGVMQERAGWTYAFMLLSAGPAAGVMAMLVLQRRLRAFDTSSVQKARSILMP
jgi:MFS family permease